MVKVVKNNTMATQTQFSPSVMREHETVKAVEPEKTRVPVVANIIKDEDLGNLQVCCITILAVTLIHLTQASHFL